MLQLASERKDIPRDLSAAILKLRPDIAEKGASKEERALHRRLP